jgi:hypothetical protein
MDLSNVLYFRSYRLATVSQLTHCSNCPACNISAWTEQKTLFLCCCFQLLTCKHACLRSLYSVTAIVFMLTSRLLPSNGSTCHNMKLSERKHFVNWFTRYRWSLNELYILSYHKYCTYYIVYITHYPFSEIDSCITSGLNAGQYSII